MEKPVQLSDHVKLMGNGHFNYYLVGKNTAALVECGTGAGALILAEQWSALAEKPAVKYIVILHSHFDHVGGLPVLKELFPQAQVVASSPARDLLKNEKYISFIADNNAVVTQLYKQKGWIGQDPPAYSENSFPVDITVGEGDKLELDSGISLEFIDAAGHSVCSIAAYIPSEQVMLISDAAGAIYSDEFIAPVFFHDYAQYLQALKKLAPYPVKAVGLGHSRIPVGTEQCRNFFDLAIACAQQSYDSIAASLATGEDETSIAQYLYDNTTIESIRHYSYDTMLASMKLMVKTVKKHQKL